MILFSPSINEVEPCKCKRLSKFGFVKGVRLGTRKLSPIFFKYQVLNPNHSGEGKICPLFSLFKIKINFTAVITLTHLSKLLFFDQSFLLFLSAIKTVTWLWQKFTLIISGRGQTKNAISLKCTAKVIFFGLLSFSCSPNSCKLCIWALAKIHTNHIGEGLI